MPEEFKKEIKIINSYGVVLEKYAGYSIINEKYLTHNKKSTQEAIKLLLAQSIMTNQDYNMLITGYMQLGLFQKYKDVSDQDLLDPDPEKYLKKRAKHKKMVEKCNKEQDLLYKEINLLAKVMTDKVKSK